MAIEHKDITEVNLHEPKGASTATSGQRLQANGSGGSSFVDNDADLVNVDDAGGYFAGTDVETVLQELGNVEYATMYVTGNATSQTATGSGTNDKWTTGWVAGAYTSASISTVNSEITIGQSGDYHIDVSLAISQTGASAATWAFKVGKDTGGGYSPIAGLVAKRTTSSTDVGSVSISGIASLTAGDKVAVFFERTAGSVDMVFQECNICINKVSV